MASFDSLLLALSPTVFYAQETKLSSGGKIKTENSQKYQIFEVARKTKMGGGLAIGALADVEPVLISEGDDNVEILVVEILASGMEIRCICGYGPQENHSVERKKKFWSRLTIEVEEAIENEKAIIFQMDGNWWAGQEIIKTTHTSAIKMDSFLKTFLNVSHICVLSIIWICASLS